MISPDRPPRSAGGVFLALGATGGALVGLAIGEPTAGLLTGFGAGLLIALLLWLAQRRR
ncbi:hypothetical protein [Sphingomonas montana]|uniref:hypothetical protein n=1 Tax=Sphingomonas montana TaxID=1843236 RepID=UPI0013EC00F0|nr:hypothetical protein [Sphingomonas montana]